VLVFVKREVHRCDCLHMLVHLYSQVLLIGSSNINFSSYEALLGLSQRTSVNTSNIVYYTAILCHNMPQTGASCSGASNRD